MAGRKKKEVAECQSGSASADPRGGKVAQEGHEAAGIEPEEKNDAETRRNGEGQTGPVVREADLVPMELIDRCALNRRIDPQSEDIIRLAADIRINQLQNPIHVVPLEGGRFMIISGERRITACREHLHWADMPAYVRNDLTPDQATELLLVDNLAQKDMTPMEEARGIRELLARGKTPQQIADRLARPVSWVMRREKLMDLSPGWIQIAGNPEGPVGTWTASHFEIIARFEHSVQDEIIKDFGMGENIPNWKAAEFRGWSVSQLREQTEDYLMELKKAPWELGDYGLYEEAGACVMCSKRTGANPTLFDEEEIKRGDNCLDRACWQEKERRFLAAKEARLREKHANLILIGRVGHGEKNDAGAKILPDYEFNKVKKSEPGALPALNITSRQLEWVKPYSDSTAREIERGANGGLSMQEKRKRLEKRRGIRYLKHVVEMLSGEIEKPVYSRDVTKVQIIAGLYSFGATMSGDILRYLNETEEAYGDADIVTRFTVYSTMISNEYVSHFDEDVLLSDIIRGLAHNMLDRIKGWQYAREWGKYRNDVLDNIMRFFRVDGDKVREQIEGEIPEPKSWKAVENSGKVAESQSGKVNPKKAQKEEVCQEE